MPTPLRSNCASGGGLEGGWLQLHWMHGVFLPRWSDNWNGCRQLGELGVDDPHVLLRDGGSEYFYFSQIQL